MARKSETEVIKELQAAFIEDMESDVRGKWLISSKDARCFMENNFEPLKRDGLLEADSDDPQKPFVQLSSIPEKIRFLEGRINFNPYLPEIVPHENETVDEASRMVADSYFNFEMADVRGPDDLNLREESDSVIHDTLVDGVGVSYHDGDDSLIDEMFRFGKPTHERLDPQKVLFDRRAANPRKQRRLHIVRPYTIDDFKEEFNRKDVDFKNIADKLKLVDPETTEDMVPVIETQIKKVSNVRKSLLTDDLQEKIGLYKHVVSQEGLRKYINNLVKAKPNEYGDLDANAIIKELPSIKVKDWETTSYLWLSGDDKYLEKPRKVGRSFSVEILRFFPINNSAYAYGIPFFLKSPQAMEIIGRTVQTRLILRADNTGGFLTSDALDPEGRSQLEENRIGEWIEVKSFGGSIRDKILPRETAAALQWVDRYLAEIQDLMNNVFGTWRGQMGQAEFAGQSGVHNQQLMASGAYMFFHFVKEINKYLSRVYRKVLDLGIKYTPKDTLMIIAGEKFPDRQKVITDGTFYEQMKKVNVEVRMDTSNEGDHAMMKDIIARLWMKDSVAPLTGARELGFKEPKRIAAEISEWRASNSFGDMVGQTVKKAPELKESIQALIKEYQTITTKGSAS